MNEKTKDKMLRTYSASIQFKLIWNDCNEYQCNYRWLNNIGKKRETRRRKKKNGKRQKIENNHWSIMSVHQSLSRSYVLCFSQQLFIEWYFINLFLYISIFDFYYKLLSFDYFLHYFIFSKWGKWWKQNTSFSIFTFSFLLAYFITISFINFPSFTNASFHSFFFVVVHELCSLPPIIL